MTDDTNLAKFQRLLQRIESLGYLLYHTEVNVNDNQCWEFAWVHPEFQIAEIPSSSSSSGAVDAASARGTVVPTTTGVKLRSLVSQRYDSIDPLFRRAQEATEARARQDYIAQVKLDPKQVDWSIRNVPFLFDAVEATVHCDTRVLLTHHMSKFRYWCVLPPYGDDSAAAAAAGSRRPPRFMSITDDRSILSAPLVVQAQQQQQQQQAGTAAGGGGGGASAAVAATGVAGVWQVNDLPRLLASLFPADAAPTASSSSSSSSSAAHVAGGSAARLYQSLLSSSSQQQQQPLISAADVFLVSSARYSPAEASAAGAAALSQQMLSSASLMSNPVVSALWVRQCVERQVSVAHIDVALEHNESAELVFAWSLGLARECGAGAGAAAGAAAGGSLQVIHVEIHACVHSNQNKRSDLDMKLIDWLDAMMQLKFHVFYKEVNFVDVTPAQPHIVRWEEMCHLSISFLKRSNLS